MFSEDDSESSSCKQESLEALQEQEFLALRQKRKRERDDEERIERAQYLEIVAEGVALGESGLIEEAMDKYLEAINLSFCDPEAHFNLGGLCQFKSKNKAALQCYNLVIDFDPHHDAAYIEKGRILHKLGSSEEALSCYSKAIQLNPSCAEHHLLQGVILFHLKRNEEALNSYILAIHYKPNYTNAYYNRGLILDDLGRYEEAIEAFENVIQIEPHILGDLRKGITWRAYVMKGLLFTNLLNFKEAIHCYDQAILLDPCHHEPHHEKSKALRSIGRYEEAKVCFKKAIVLGKEEDRKAERAMRAEKRKRLGLRSTM